MSISLSESGWQILRSAAPLLLPLLGIGIILASLYAYTEWATKASAKKSLPIGLPDYLTMFEDPDPPLLLYQLPYPAELTSEDGRTVRATLTARPSRQEITFRRHWDQQMFTIHKKLLSPESRKLVENFPVSGGPINLPTPIAERIFPLLPHYQDPEVDLPYACTLHSREGQSISVTLLERPAADLITFRRNRDQRLFTINIDRLTKADQSMIQRFTIGAIY